MNNDTMEPLGYFQNTGQKRHYDLTISYFEDLVKNSCVDPEKNRATVKEYKEQLIEIENLNKKISKNKTKRLLWILGMIAAVIISLVISAQVIVKSLMFAGAAVLIFFGIRAIVKKLNPIIRNFNSVLEEEKRRAEQLLEEAQAQMAPLNALFDDNDTQKIIEQTIPELKFDPYYTTTRDRIFRTQNDLVDITDEETSVIDTLSGTYMDNPFLFQRVKQHVMGSCTYHGELEISWIEYYTDGDGNRCSRRRYQTLYASVEKPEPCYIFRTYLHYGAQGAPDLTFSRQSKHIEQRSEKAIKRAVKSGEKELQRKARRAVKAGETFTEMANSEFDVLFGAVDRDNEVQFRMMYTPLAQVETVKLLKSNVAFGDDFDFYKNGRCNTIMSDHAQEWDMDTSPEKYYDYDIDVIRDKFLTANATYFKSIFFDFAPLFAVPLYQQRPVKSLEDPTDISQRYTNFEYECVANSIDYHALAHEDTETDVIVKAEYSQTVGQTDCVELTAYSYTTVERVDYVSVLGGDGNFHDVPVLWLEYIPLSRTTSMAVRDFGVSQRELLQKLQTPFGDAVAAYADRCAYSHGMLGFVFEEGDSADHLENLAKRYT